MTEYSLHTPRDSTVLTALNNAAPDELLRPDVSFSSPFADYHGQADVIHLFGLIARVLQSPAVTTAATDGTWTYTSFTGQVDGRELQGVVCERHDEVGLLLHATLFLRPYRMLRSAMDAMGRLLANAPLPSTR